MIALPLYAMADKWQEQERDIQKKLKSKLDNIKAVFRGNEQHMLIRTYYRQNNYHPIYSLRSLLGLLIQIPFFIAAYHYLGHLEILSGQSYGLIKDLSRPDGIISFFGYKNINILPIIMTVINICSISVYSKKLNFRETIQLYFVAMLFLVLLYSASSALVIYWTMNNVFSFFKHLIYSSKNPKRNFRIAILAFLSAVMVFSLLCNFKSFLILARIEDIISPDFKALILLIVSVVSTIIYLVITNFGAAIDKFIQKAFCSIYEDDKFKNNIFILSCSVLFIISGLTAVSFLIASSPQEFAVNGSSLVNPARFLCRSTLQAFAVFLVYPCLIYFLFSKKVKFYLAVLFAIASFSSIINLFLFTGDYGVIYPRLIFENMDYLFPSIISGLLNTLAIIAVVALFTFLIRLKFKKIFLYSLSVIIISLIAVSLCNVVAINKDYNNMLEIFKKTDYAKEQSSTELKSVFNLSKSGKNVFIIMLDRAIGGYIEEIMRNSPELLEKMNGFIWYKNTVSYNGHTVMGLPPVFGGYEYTPIETNKRDTIPLVTKHNESLLVMPRIFSDAGYKVTFTDPMLVDYNRIPGLQIFDRYKNVNALTLIGKCTQKWINDPLTHIEMPKEDIHKDIMSRYLLKFGIFRILPNYVRFVFYNQGTWLSVKSDRFRIRKSWDIGDIEKLIDNYSILDYLPGLTSFNSEYDTFTIMVNEVIHYPAMLKPPDYIPGIDTTQNPDYTPTFTDTDSLGHFYTQVGAFRQICEWLDYLKENNVYDNTKIIIVSDHGYNVSNPFFKQFADNWDDTYEYSWYQPLLMVKDFNSNSEFSISDEFMTNADVPAIALKHLGEVRNPFTGKVINSDLKKKGAFIVRSHNYSTAKQGKYKYSYVDGDIIIVNNNIFIKENWIKLKK